MTDTDRINALDVERPCNPPTTHRYRRVGQLALLCCVRCGQGKSDIVGVTLAAPAEGLREAAQAAERWIADDCQPSAEWVAEGHNVAMSGADRDRGATVLLALRAALKEPSE